MTSLPHCVHFDLDGAWPADLTPSEDYVDVRAWGPRLRYCTTAREIEAFAEFARPRLAPFTLFGSGDFHHLSALWLRRTGEPCTLLSFDNHPDWDIRPPRWCCGTWINRALELPAVRRAAIWGCGNFELNWPGSLFVSATALRKQRLTVWPWAERLKPSGRKRWPGMSRANWREQFSAFARGLSGGKVYVTIDLDCLDTLEAATNWEQGLYQAADLVWALGEVRAHAEICGGDLCGAHSEPHYARRLQKLSAQLDHPATPALSAADADALNQRAFHAIWPALTGGGGIGRHRDSLGGAAHTTLTGRDQRDSRADQQHADP